MHPPIGNNLIDGDENLLEKMDIFWEIENFLHHIPNSLKFPCQVLVQFSFGVGAEVHHKIHIHGKIPLHLLNGPFCCHRRCDRIIRTPEPCAGQLLAQNARTLESIRHFLPGSVFIENDICMFYAISAADV